MSCVSRDTPDDYVARISRCTRAAHVDSLLYIRDELSQDENTHTRQEVLAMVADSAADIEAMALVLTCDADVVAGKLLSNLSADRYNAVCRAYDMLGEQTEADKMTRAMQRDFDAMTTEQQAVLLTSSLTPYQIERGLQPGDSLLKKEITRIQSQPQ